MYAALPNEYLVPFDGSFDPGAFRTSPHPHQCELPKGCLARQVRRIAEAQRVLYADDRHAVLLIFQAMDAAGKDGTIRAVLSGVNPAGCHVVSFKRPSTVELDHDFLWRTTRALPGRGMIGVFNRSYYEEVLIVRVHPELLKQQHIPTALTGPDVYERRYESIREHEAHLARNGVMILKFFLNVSRSEQRRRFLSRLRTPRKHWKFSAADVAEAAHWDRYMEAYTGALNATSRSWAPWYAIPADDKRYMRLTVATIVADAIEGLGLSYPEQGPERRAEIRRLRAELVKAERAEGKIPGRKG